MLILTRKHKEVIQVNDDIKMIILNIKDHQVQIGIEAPRDIAVHREEIYQRIQAEKHTEISTK